MVDRMPMAQRLAARGSAASSRRCRTTPALQAFVEALGVRYLGPIDGHDHADLDGIRLPIASRSRVPCWCTS
jgi:1-deoxy-D-xylulose-5-phosphate synthase